jgi:hypothetical protein
VHDYLSPSTGLKENKFDGIYVGRQKRQGLVYAGKVDRGFDTASAKELQARLKPLIRKTQPYAKRMRIGASGRAVATGGDRATRQVGRRQVAASVLQGMRVDL